MPSQTDLKTRPIAFVYQESEDSIPTYKIHSQKEKIGSEDIDKFAKSVVSIRDQIKFLTKEEINKMFDMESLHIRPFNEEEKNRVFF